MKNLEFTFSARTSYVDALAVCDKIKDRDVIIDYDLKSTADGLVCYFKVPEFLSDNDLIQLGGIFSIVEINQTSVIRKFNEARRNES